MSVLLAVLMTLAAGAVGAVIRALVVERAPRAGTAAVNLAGTLLLALVLVGHDRGTVGDATALVLGVGLSGSLTTFSGWVALLEEGWRDAPVRTTVLDLMAPVLAAVGVVVLVFATIG